MASFGENLLSPTIENSATLGYLLSLTFRGHASETPTNVKHLLFLEKSSNSTTTTLEVLQNYLKTAKPREGQESPDYVIANADVPLYV